MSLSPEKEGAAPRRRTQWGHALVATAAVSTVVFGLRFGAPTSVRAAVVYGARPARAGSAIAWPVVVLDGDDGVRSAVARAEVTVSARLGERAAEWRGVTNDDGVAEALLALDLRSIPSPIHVDLDVRSAGAVLARGRAAWPELPKSPASPAWMPFARREGAIALDVAIAGGRAAPGFAAAVWVRATEAAGPSRGARIAGVAIEAERETSLASAVPRSTTDAEGWAWIDVVPVGLAVAMHLSARGGDGRSGEWTGGLTMSPGAASVTTRARWSPAESPVFDVAWPAPRTAAYFEVDDASGRAWASTSLDARVTAPPLAPGLYWIVASSDPASGAALGPGSIARPFVVAGSDEAALAYGADPDECGATGDPRLPPRRLATCLAVTATSPTPRWIALDGFVAAHAHDAETRVQGLAVAVGAVLTAMALEAALLLRAAVIAGARLRSVETLVDEEGCAAGQAGREGSARTLLRGVSAAVGVLVALLGFLLLAAFLLRAS